MKTKCSNLVVRLTTFVLFTGILYVGLMFIDLQLLVIKLESLLLGKGLAFLLQRVGWEVGLFFSILLALLNLEDATTLGNMMSPPGTSSPKLLLPASSPVPSISSGGSSLFDEWFGAQTGASSSASAAEAEKVVIPSPEISQGELLGSTPEAQEVAQPNPQNAPANPGEEVNQPIQPQPPVAGPSASVEQAEPLAFRIETKQLLKDFLSSFGKKTASNTFVNRIASELKLEGASPQKLLKVCEVMEEALAIARRRGLNSGQNAAAHLIMEIENWERRFPEG